MEHWVKWVNSTSLKIPCSNLAINSTLYREANLVSIAVPRNFFKVFLPKVKTLLFSTTSANSAIVEVLTFFSLLKSKRFL